MPRRWTRRSSHCSRVGRATRTCRSTTGIVPISPCTSRCPDPRQRSARGDSRLAALYAAQNVAIDVEGGTIVVHEAARRCLPRRGSGECGAIGAGCANGAPMNMPERNTPAVEHAIARAVNFELTIADLAKRSERRAWRVAAAALAMSLVLLGGYFYLLPLKEKVPYLVMADAYTGTSTVARLTGDFNHNSITSSEAVNRSNVAHFVLARESYDYALIRLRDWTTVYTMASPEVAAGYTRLHSSQQSGQSLQPLRQDHAIRVAILSIQFLGADQRGPKARRSGSSAASYDHGNGVPATGQQDRNAPIRLQAGAGHGREGPDRESARIPGDAATASTTITHQTRRCRKHPACRRLPTHRGSTKPRRKPRMPRPRSETPR